MLCYLFQIVVLPCIWLPVNLLSGGSCWRLVAAEEIGGGFFNAFSFFRECVIGPALIFGGIGLWQAPWGAFS